MSAVTVGGEFLEYLGICGRQTYLKVAKIKVVGLEGGFINSFLQIHTQCGPMVVRIVVDSVNISTYDTYERRSYAQAVVNGKRVFAGLGEGGAKVPVQLIVQMCRVLV